MKKSKVKKIKIETTEINPKLEIEKSENEKQNFSVKEILVFVKNFTEDHPTIAYKIAPLSVGVYILFPLVEMVWNWLPWIWVMFDIYKKIPPEGLKDVYEKGKKYLKEFLE